MKAITIKQPWASLIVHCGKDVENRTWATTYRGPVLIHAGKNLDDAECYSASMFILNRNIQARWNRDLLPLGGIIGIAHIVDCVQQCDSPWFVGPFGWVLEYARPLPFHACRGALSLWNCEYPHNATSQATQQAK